MTGYAMINIPYELADLVASTRATTEGSHGLVSGSNSEGSFWLEIQASTIRRCRSGFSPTQP